MRSVSILIRDTSGRDLRNEVAREAILLEEKVTQLGTIESLILTAIVLLAVAGSLAMFAYAIRLRRRLEDLDHRVRALEEKKGVGAGR